MLLLQFIIIAMFSDVDCRPAQPRWRPIFETSPLIIAHDDLYNHILVPKYSEYPPPKISYTSMHSKNVVQMYNITMVSTSCTLT